MASVIERVGDLDESQIIDRIQRFLCGTVHTEVGVGDDAAVVRAPDGRVVVSTDALVEGHHFRREWSSARDVGWRAGTQNLADIVAMGASPTSMVVALGVPRDTPVQWVMDFYDGLSQVCATVGAEIVGGDLTAAPVIMVAVTVHGNLGGQPRYYVQVPASGTLLLTRVRVGGQRLGLHCCSMVVISEEMLLVPLWQWWSVHWLHFVRRLLRLFMVWRLSMVMPARCLMSLTGCCAMWGESQQLQGWGSILTTHSPGMTLNH